MTNLPCSYRIFVSGSLVKWFGELVRDADSLLNSLVSRARWHFGGFQKRIVF
jgi:hypothetical protein